MTLPAQRRHLAPTRGSRARDCVLAVLLATTLPTAAAEAEPQRCKPVEIVLWGDGKHDDSAALNAWLAGDAAVWATGGEPVGARISGRRFRLSAATYVPGGTGRRLEDFRLDWPERGESVAGGVIAAGDDPDAAPRLSGVSISGGDPDEGMPFESPAAAPAQGDDRASCAIS